MSSAASVLTLAFGLYIGASILAGIAGCVIAFRAWRRMSRAHDEQTARVNRRLGLGE